MFSRFVLEEQQQDTGTLVCVWKSVRLFTDSRFSLRSCVQVTTMMPIWVSTLTIFEQGRKDPRSLHLLRFYFQGVPRLESLRLETLIR